MKKQTKKTVKKRTDVFQLMHTDLIESLSDISMKYEVDMEIVVKDSFGLLGFLIAEKDGRAEAIRLAHGALDQVKALKKKAKK